MTFDYQLTLSQFGFYRWNWIEEAVVLCFQMASTQMDLHQLCLEICSSNSSSKMDFKWLVFSAWKVVTIIDFDCLQYSGKTDQYWQVSSYFIFRVGFWRIGFVRLDWNQASTFHSYSFVLMESFAFISIVIIINYSYSQRC